YPWPLSPLFRTLILCHPPPTADIPTLSLHDALPIYRPSSASATSSELATSEPTFTRADWPKIMPLGLSRNTRPLAVMLPRIRLGSCDRMRLRATASLEGWLKLTRSCAATSKESQLMLTFCEDWSICVRFAS